MIVIKNKKELINQKSKINSGLHNQVEFDVDIISNEFDNVSEEYGPLLLIINEDEQEEIKKKYPILSNLQPEEYELVYKDENEEIFRTCYILTEGGFIVYVRKELSNV